MMLALGQIAKVKLVDQVNQIAREDTQRRVSVLINVRDRDTASFVAEATKALHEKVKFPNGYYFEFGGQFKNLMEAKQRLTIVVPLALALIFVLIFLTFNSLRQAALIFLCVPLAVTGGIFALWLRSMPFTISAAVGFIVLAGVAVLNGLVVMSSIRQRLEGGMALTQAIIEGAMEKVRPVVMTGLVPAIGFIPMALAHGTGAEVQKPLAMVVIGGLITSTALTLLVLPAITQVVLGIAARLRLQGEATPTLAPAE